MDGKQRLNQLLREFFRYLIVGGAAFLVDFGVLNLSCALLPPLFGYRLYIATALGFIAGLVFNYALSPIFVFKAAKKTGAGRSVKAFTVFAVIGIVGLGLTELGMYAGTALLRLDFRLVKIVVTAFVLLWNYAGRKILIFK
jgi:putative flippase GtrA